MPRNKLGCFKNTSRRLENTIDGSIDSRIFARRIVGANIVVVDNLVGGNIVVDKLGVGSSIGVE